MRQEGFKDNNNIKQVGRVLCIKYIKSVFYVYIYIQYFFWMNPKLR